ncbi:hypothetical protein GWK47_006698 [Chionoecetes opilio]|uniref:Uncharacterized protein n=1 Tax=Chionoecetes opilio TaxID=41210 RepID=A0A8J5CSC1_CHIOP|nr:hypothetical protein GWK47_006698 [Chionoecetes opilio]
MDEGGRTHTLPLVCSDSREDVVGGSAKVKLNLYSASGHPWFPSCRFSPFWTRSRGSALPSPRQKIWCRNEEVDECSTNSAVAEGSRSPNSNHLSPFQSLCNSFLLPLLLSSSHLTCFPRIFAMPPCHSTHSHFPSGPFGRRGSPCPSVWTVGSWRKKWPGEAANCRQWTRQVPWRRASETLSPSELTRVAAEHIFPVGQDNLAEGFKWLCNKKQLTLDPQRPKKETQHLTRANCPLPQRFLLLLFCRTLIYYGAHYAHPPPLQE